MPERDWYSTAEVAALVGLSRSGVLAVAERGDMPAPYRHYGRWRWAKAAIDAHVAGQKAEREKEEKRLKEDNRRKRKRR